MNKIFEGFTRWGKKWRQSADRPLIHLGQSFSGIFDLESRVKPFYSQPLMGDDSLNLACKVTPNARRSEIVGWGADEQGRRVLLVKLAAPALEGKANKELVRFLAEWLDCGKGEVSLLRGDTSRTKLLRVPAMAQERLQTL